jgi:uncharacterized repeat protein (TIGR02543 family)
MRKKLLISMAATTILLGTTCVALSACGSESSVSVTFRNWDESELYTVECKNGEETNYPDTSVPVRADDEQYTYTFIGWRDSEGKTYNTLPAVSGNVTYTAIFKETLKSYQVSFKQEDTVLSQSTMTYGTAVTYTGATPEKQADAQYTYAFAGWSDGTQTYQANALPSVTGDAVYTAVFTPTTNEYTVTWQVGTESSTSTVAYGSAATYNGETPTQQATAQYTYAFLGWATEANGEVLPADQFTVTGNITYYAVFGSTVNKYAVTFKDEDGTVLSNAELDYGTAVAYTGTTPTKQNTKQYTYTFAGWVVGDVQYSTQDTLPTVTSEMVCTAYYTSQTNSYKVSWMVGDTLTENKVQYGLTPLYNGTPEKASDAEYSYTFAGWATEENGTVLSALPQVEGDVTYYAVFQSHILSYNVIWVVDGQSTTTAVNVNQVPTYSGETPTKEPTQTVVYTFAGWAESAEGQVLSELPAVTQATTFYAVFTESARKYTLTIQSFIGNAEQPFATKEMELAYGESYSISDTKIEKYVSEGVTYLPDTFGFAGKITENTTLRVTYGEASVWDGTSASASLSGEGTEASPYLIQSANDLAYLSKVSNQKTYGSGLYFKLTTNIDLNGKEWTPICNYGKGTAGTYTCFQGKFDGDGHTIAGIYYNNSSICEVGLFSTLSTGADIHDLVLQGEITAMHRAGGLAGGISTADVKVTNIIGFVDVSTTLDGKSASYTGGIVGSAKADTISNCVNYGNVTGTGNYIGGITGYTSGTTISNCTNYGNVTSAGNYIGGIIGSTVSTTISNCSNYGSILDTGASTKGFGGICGWFTTKSIMTSCHNYGDVEGNSNVGGLAGYLGKGSTIDEECTNSGKITGTSAYGELVGFDAN